MNMKAAKGIEEIYPLSPMQQGMLFHTLLSPDSGAYVVQIAYEIHGAIDPVTFERAWQTLMQRHSILRSAFVWQNLEQPLQVVGQYCACPVTIQDWRTKSPSEQQQQLIELKQQQRTQGFALSKAPLMQVTLIQLADHTYQLIWYYHHLLLDGWSLPILLQEFLAIYQGRSLPATPPYRNYIAWLKAQSPSQAQTFWQDYLQGFIQPNQIGHQATVKRSPDARSEQYNCQTVKLDPTELQSLQQLAQQHQVTLNTCIQAAWGLLISRYSNSRDVVFGIVSSGRPVELPQIDRMVGLFVNTMPLRVQLQSDESQLETLIVDYLKQVQRQAQRLSNYEYSSLIEIQSWSAVPRSQQLFETILVFENYPVLDNWQAELQEIQIQPIDAREQTNYPLTLYAVADQALTLELQYQADRFSEGFIQNMLGQLKQILQQMPQVTAIDQIPQLTPNEQELLNSWNSVPQTISSSLSIIAEFEQHCQQQPDAIALTVPSDETETVLTYHALNQLVNQISQLLIEQGVQVGNRLGICLSRSANLVATILAVLKIGAVYVPLDQSQAPQRLSFILEDAQIQRCITDRWLTNLPESIRQINLNQLTERPTDQTFEPTPIDLSKDSSRTAYILYTSGSTGQPKGVQISHQNLINCLQSFRQDLSIKSADVMLATTTIGFDIAGLELLLPLIAGAQVVLLESARNPDRVIQALTDYQITFMQATPATWHLLLTAGWQGQANLTALCGGEAMDAPLANALVDRCGRVWNVYGPTETTIWSATQPVTQDLLQTLAANVTVPIGRPIANTQFYLLDQQQQAVPVGAIGELYIAGDGVMQGYWQRPELNQTKIINYQGQRCYATGDRACYSDSGNLIYLGRIDEQIKLRGYRIEPSEIAAAVMQHPQIDQAVVCLCGEGDVAYLAGYYTSQSSIAVSELIAWLSPRLPDYMIPKQWMQLDAMPLNSSGKVDRRSLPQLAPLSRSITTAQTPVQQDITVIWQQLLNIPVVGLDDNFFDLGGHSLLIVRMQGMLKEKFSQEIPLVELFRYPTVRTLASYLQPEHDRPLEESSYASNSSLIPQSVQAKSNQCSEIAIIGMAGRFPQADNLEQFWENLCQGVEAIRSLTAEELATVDPAELQHPHYVKSEGAIAGIEQFDANFFGYSPREAEILDPQQRWFLESAWTALEDAGYDPQQYSGAIGVFAGAAANSYMLNLYSDANIWQQVSRYQLMIANDKDFLTTRTSYKLNLSGPSVTVQTACSSSLVAVHLACQSLLTGESDMALAGGVSLSEPTGYLYQEEGIYSPDGHCRPFDALAQGTVAGSGVGIVVLKRLEDAQRDGDHIYAVVKGSAINNDGNRKVSYTAPSVEAQAAVIRSAQLAAQVSPETISYVEAHGTGTPMGDPIEVAALTQAFRQQTDRQQFCGLGSLKSNIGHLDAAAGVAGLIKTALALHHRQLPPTVHCQTPNPQLHLTSSPFYLMDTLQPLSGDSPLRAAVSSFGIGGTNAHMILQEAPTIAAVDSPSATPEFTAPLLFPLSAKTPTALSARVQQLIDWLQRSAEITSTDFAHLAHTLQVGRQAMIHRAGFIASQPSELLQQLQAWQPQAVDSAAESKMSPIVFLFPGQGSQYGEMAKDWYEQSALFRQIFDQGCRILADDSDVDYDLQSVIYGDHRSRLNQTEIAQPAIFLIEYAIAKCLIQLGIQPQVMLGHSIGEYVAATLAGVFSFESAMQLIRDRAKWMQACPTGAMLSINQSVESLRLMLNENLTVAAENAPELCVVAGNVAAIANLEKQLIAKNIHAKRLQTSHAFHSAAMQAAATPLRQQLQSMTLNPPQQLWLSNLTGDWITPEQAVDPEYWVSHLLSPVKMRDCLMHLTHTAHYVIEVGAGTGMVTLMQQVAKTTASQPNSYFALLHHPQSTEDDRGLLFRCLRSLWTSGHSIRWTNCAQILPVSSPALLRRLHIPTYPFERQRYWVSATRINEIVPSLPLETILSDKPQHDDFNLYETTWVRSTNTLNGQASSQKLSHIISQQYRRWLILSNDSPVMQALLELLQDHNQDVIQLKIGEKFEQVGYRQFALSPTQESDWQAFWEDLADRELLPDQILVLWPNSGFTDNFWRLIYLARSLNAHQHSAQLLLVSDQVHGVLGNETLQPEMAMLSSLAIVMQQEMPQMTCRCVDLPLNSSNCAQYLIGEALNDGNNAIVAYRGHYRWLPQYQTIDNSIDSESLAIIAGQIYVVVGDFATGLGNSWITWLQAQGATVVAVSDLSQPFGSTNSDVVHITANLTDCHSLEAAFNQVKIDLGQITGIFYSTPMSQPESMAEISTITTSHLETVLKTKIYRLQTLIETVESLSAESPIAFCCIQSSLSTSLGGISLAAYATANAAIDMLIQQQIQSSSVAWYSINWDHYGSDLEFEQDLADSAIAQRFAAQSLSTEAIHNATAKILQLGAQASITQTSIVVAKGDFHQRRKTWVQSQRPSTTHQPSAVAPSQHDRPNLSTTYVAPRDAVEQAVAEIWQELLGIQAIGVEDSFFDLGGHSLLAVQTISRIRDHFGVDLAMRSLLYESPTIAGIAAVIRTAMPSEQDVNEVEALLDEIQNMPPEAIELALQGKPPG
jgi:amino acid adenylation domain-containing protein